MNQTLSRQNHHPLDNFVRFYAKGHKYEIITDPNSKYVSVTTWNHKQFPKFDADAVIMNIFKSKSWGPGHKYWGLTREQIKSSWKSNGDAVSDAGTKLHEQIERFMNNEHIIKNYTHKELYNYYSNTSRSEMNFIPSKEWNYFLQFVKDHPQLKPYRTEWMIFHDNLKIAGSIDMVYENPDGTLSVYDWKRSKEITKINNWDQFAINPIICHLPDANFWHYALQLNTYKKILEEKYGKIVTNLYLVRLHPDNKEDSYELLEVPILTKEITDLFEERKKEVST